jgi:glucose-1-phosphate adenylyltransferase
VHILAGAEVHDSVLFFDNIVHPGAQLNRVVSDVNTVYNEDVQIGTPEGGENAKVSVIGWNNNVPQGFRIGSGCTVGPRIAAETWPRENLEDGEELR